MTSDMFIVYVCKFSKNKIPISAVQKVFFSA